MAANKRTKVQKENDKNFVMDLYLKGNSFRAIAVELNKIRPYSLDHSQIFYDVEVVLRQWKKDRDKLIDYYKTIELEKLNTLEREYWHAWEKSKDDYKQKSITLKGNGVRKVNKNKISQIEEQIKEMIQYGDPRFLAGIERCIERRCKILGVDAPEQKDLNIKNNSKIIVIDKETEKELKKLRDGE